MNGIQERDLKGRFVKGSIPKIKFNKSHQPWNKGKKGLQIAWNKGLTKETDDRVKKYCENVVPFNKGRNWEEIYGIEEAKIRKDGHRTKFFGKNNPFYGKHHTKKTKILISKNNSGKHSEKKGKIYEELYGEERAKEIKEKKSIERKGKTWEEIFGVETTNEMKKIAAEKQGRPWEDRFGVEGAKKARKKLSEKISGENHPLWKGGSNEYPYGYNWKEQKEKVLLIYDNKSAMSGKKEKLNVHHVHPRRNFLQFIYDKEFFSNFHEHNKHLARILFSYVIPDALVDEMNDTNNLIPLTNSEHQRYGRNCPSFFEEFKIKER